MDYNQLIEQLRSTESRSKRAMLDDAAAAIETLMAERDAAVADLKACSNNSCVMCKWFDGNNHCTAEEPCSPNDNWEWRGLQRED